MVLNSSTSANPPKKLIHPTLFLQRFRSFQPTDRSRPLLKGFQSGKSGFPSKGSRLRVMVFENTYQGNKNGSLRYLNKPWVLTLLNCQFPHQKHSGKPSFQLLFLAEVPDVVRPSQKSALCQGTHEAFLTTTDVHVGTKVFMTSTQVHHILGNFNEQKRLYDGNSQSSKTPRM